MNRHLSLLIVPAALALSLTGCESGPGPPEPAPDAPTTAAATPPGALPTGSTQVRLDPADFTHEITNPYSPMTPRTRWTYSELESSGATKTVTVVVTTKTKRIANGVLARVVRDTVREDGEIVEDTYDWYAQDRQGNVWYLGEDTAEFSDGKITSREGSFEAGVDGAQAGIAMPAAPRPGLRYRQEYYAGEAEDNGEVLSTAEQVQVPAGRYRGALLTKDTITIEPNVAEYKLYARGVGLVLALGISGGGSREELVKVDRAGPTDGTGPLGNPNP